MKYNDNELIYYIKEGNQDDAQILYDKYSPYMKTLVSKTIKTCKNTGLEECDLYQEGMIGLMNAIDTFDEYKENKFFTYAKACIEKRIASTIIASSRNKHKIMNESVLIDDTNIPLFQTKSSYDMLMEVENENEILNKIRNNITDFEDQVLQLKLGGLSNSEICNILDITTKKIENAMYRIKIKTSKLLNK